MHPVIKATQIIDTLRNQACELELVTRLHLADGTTQEITHTRRAVCKKTTRRQNKTVLTFVDQDRSALEQTFPPETFTVADFPELFADHVGRRVPQGVGTARKVPMTWIVKTGGSWKYAGPKVIGAAGTVLAVYRGFQTGQGAVVDPAEYTIGTATGASTGVTVLTVNFTREQIDFQGRPYLIEIDCSLPGSRIPADELQRVLAAYGIDVNAASFAAAAAYDTGAGFSVDALYGGDQNGRTGNAIAEDLLRVARAWLEPDATGAWALVQDAPRASVATYDTSADQIEVEEYGDGDIPKTVTLAYHPKSGVGEAFANQLSRTTTGVAGEMHISSPYISDHGVADRLVCYWQKRLNTLRQANGSIYAVQRANGDRITVTDSIHWVGSKDFIMTGISRPADRNQVALREYDAEVYVYTAGALPADATNGYSPDYAYTPPAAPTGLAVVSQGAIVASDGTMTSYALIRAVPPAVNWARLMVQATNTGTGEIYQAQLILAGANYEARVTGMHPGQAHTVVAWAANARNVDGAATPPVGFNSATFSTDPAAPTALTVVSQSATVDADGKVTSSALIRATPPAQYFARIMAQVANDATGEVQQAQLRLNAGNYEATFAGLRPNRAHTVVTWAVNQANGDGSVAAPVAFTSANHSSLPAAPTGLAINQGTGRTQRVSWVMSSSGSVVKEYIVFRKTGAGGTYAEYRRVNASYLLDEAVAYGTTYYYKVRAVDRIGNESADSTEISNPPSRNIGDADIPTGGINGGTIGDASINRGRSYTGTGSGSIALNAAPNQGQLSMDLYTFFPGIDIGASAASSVSLIAAANKPGAGDYGVVRCKNDDASTSVTVNIGWRKFNT